MAVGVGEEAPTINAGEMPSLLNWGCSLLLQPIRKPVNPPGGEPPTGEPCAVDPHARLCVQLRLVCSVGVSLTRVIDQSPVAWMAGVRETDHLKPIDKAIMWMVSESAGRNESECAGGLESA